MEQFTPEEEVEYQNWLRGMTPEKKDALLKRYSGVTQNQSMPGYESNQDELDYQTWLKGTPTVIEQPDEPEGGIGTALIGGVKEAGSSLRTAWNVLSGDTEEAQEVANQRSVKTLSQQAFMQNLQARKQEAGDDSVMQAIANVAGAAWENPRGAIHEVAAQLPNSGVIMGSMFTGAKIAAIATAGNPIAAMAGGIVGLLFGNVSIETGGIAKEQFAEGGFDRSDVLKKGAIKGGVITGVDAATMGATRLMFSPFYKAANKASQQAIAGTLKANGINPLDKIAVKTALSSDQALAKAVQQAGVKAASKAMPAGVRSAGLHGTAVGLDMIGEGTGEYAGSVAAGLDASLTDAVMEAMMSIPQSAGEVAVSKSLAKAKSTLIGENTSIDNTSSGSTEEYAEETTFTPEQNQEFLNSVKAELDAGYITPAEVVNLANKPQFANLKDQINKIATDREVYAPIKETEEQIQNLLKIKKKTPEQKQKISELNEVLSEQKKDPEYLNLEIERLTSQIANLEKIPSGNPRAQANLKRFTAERVELENILNSEQITEEEQYWADQEAEIKRQQDEVKARKKQQNDAEKKVAKTEEIIKAYKTTKDYKKREEAQRTIAALFSPGVPFNKGLAELEANIAEFKRIRSREKSVEALERRKQEMGLDIEQPVAVEDLDLSETVPVGETTEKGLLKTKETSEIKPETPLKQTKIDPWETAKGFIRDGIDRQSSYSHWVKVKNLKPEIDAKEWYKIYDSVLPEVRAEQTQEKMSEADKKNIEKAFKDSGKITPELIADNTLKADSERTQLHKNIEALRELGLKTGNVSQADDIRVGDAVNVAMDIERGYITLENATKLYEKAVETGITTQVKFEQFKRVAKEIVAKQESKKAKTTASKVTPAEKSATSAEKSAEQIKANSGKPYQAEGNATAALERKGLSATHKAIKVEGGWVGVKIPENEIEKFSQDFVDTLKSEMWGSRAGGKSVKEGAYGENSKVRNYGASSPQWFKYLNYSRKEIDDVLNKALVGTHTMTEIQKGIFFEIETAINKYGTEAQDYSHIEALEKEGFEILGGQTFKVVDSPVADKTEFTGEVSDVYDRWTIKGNNFVGQKGLIVPINMEDTITIEAIKNGVKSSINEYGELTNPDGSVIFEQIELFGKPSQKEMFKGGDLVKKQKKVYKKKQDPNQGDLFKGMPPKHTAIDLFAPDTGGVAGTGSPKAKKSRQVDVGVRVSGNLQSHGLKVNNAGEVASIFEHLINDPQESLYIVSADKNNNILEIHEYSRGGSYKGIAEPTAIAGRVLNEPKATQVYFIHNHPSGHAGASLVDMATFQKINKILKLKKVLLHSGIIIGKDHKSGKPTYKTFTGTSQISAAIPINPVAKPETIKTKKRWILRSEPNKIRIMRPDQAQMYLIDKKSGFVLLDNKNQVVGFMEFEPGIKSKELTGEIIKEIEKSNASAIIIYNDDASKPERLAHFKDLARSMQTVGIGALSVIQKINGNMFDWQLTDTKKLSKDDKIAKLQEWEAAWDRIDTSEPVFQTTENQKDLTAYHNTTEPELMAAIESGGLAVPSMAITQKDIPFEKYGEITLVGNKNLIDPTDADNKIYESDIYSTRIPEKEYDRIHSKSYDLFQELKPAFDETGTYLSDWDHRSRNQLLNEINMSNGWKVAFLRNKGIPISIPQKDIKISNNFLDTESFRKFVKENPDIDMWNIRPGDADYKKVSDAFKNSIREYSLSKRENKKAQQHFYESYIKSNFDKETGLVHFSQMRGVEKAAKIIKKPGKEIDKEKLTQRIKNKFTKKLDLEYQAWAKQKIKGIYSEPYIKKGRRKLPVTLANMVDIMLGKKTTASERTIVFGVAKAKGASAKQFKTIAALHKNKSKLAKIEEVKKYINEIQSPARDLYQSEVEDYYKHDDIAGAMDSSMKAIATYLGGRQTKPRMEMALRQNDFIGVPAWVVDSAMDFANILRDTPTQYFEGKLRRAVQLNEFTGAVIPKTASKEFKQALKDSGLKYRLYDATDKEARQKAVQLFQKRKDVLFQTEKDKKDALHKTKERDESTDRPQSLGKREQAENLKKILSVRGDTKSVRVVNPLTKKHKTYTKIGKLFGLDVVLFRTNSAKLNNISGFTDPARSNTIFINIASSNPAMGIIGHEAIHQFKNQHPEEYKNLAKVIKSESKNYQEFADDLKASRERLGMGIKDDAIFDEFMAEFGNDQFQRPEFWEKMHKENPTLVEKLVDTINKIVQKIKSVLTRSEQYLSDVEKAQDALVKAMGGFAAVTETKGKTETKLQTKEPTNMLPRPILSDKEISDVGRDLDYGDIAKKQLIKELKNKGIKYIDGYHVFDSKEKDISESIETGAPWYGKDEAVYLFLDPDDIKLSAPYFALKDDGDLGKTLSVAHIKIPVDDMINMSWDGLFNSQFGTYSSVYITKDIPAKQISSIVDVHIPSSEEYKKMYGDRNTRYQTTKDQTLKKEYESTKKKYQGTKEWLKAPNGKKSNLGEHDWVMTRTPRFKAWFGDSKVLDENGDPLVVYHATEDTFTVFEDKGTHEGTVGMFKTKHDKSYGSKKIQAYLKIKNPLDLRDGSPQKSLKSWLNKLGVSAPVFPQIKSAIDEEMSWKEDISSTDYDNAYNQVFRHIEDIEFYLYEERDIDEVLNRIKHLVEIENIYGDNNYWKKAQAEISNYISSNSSGYWEAVIKRFTNTDWGKGKKADTFTALFQLEHPFYDIEVDGVSPIIKHIKNNGYDGVAWVDDNNDAERGIDSFLVFKDTQIKSTYNRGAWDSKNPDIMLQTTEEGRYLELAKNPKKNKAELQQMVNNAATARGFASFDSEYPTLQSLIDGVKNGELLVHSRKIKRQDIEDLKYGLEPTIGSTLKSTEAIQTAEEYDIEPEPLIFASDEFDWAGQGRNGLVFIRKEGFQKSLGGGNVETDAGETIRYEMSDIADHENMALKDEPYGVETNDWYSNQPAEVVGVAPFNLKSADTVTYDDKGGIIPLSRRFDVGRQDVRFQTTEEGIKNRTNTTNQTAEQDGQKYQGSPERGQATIERVMDTLKKTTKKTIKKEQKIITEYRKLESLAKDPHSSIASKQKMLAQFLSVLPIEVRAKVIAPLTFISRFKQTEIHKKRINEALSRAEKELTTHLRRAVISSIQKGITPKKLAKSGIKKDNIGHEAARDLQFIREVLKEKNIQNRMALIESQLEAKKLEESPSEIVEEEISNLESHRSIIETFGNLKNQKLEDLLFAQEALNSIIVGGKAWWRAQQDAFKAMVDPMTAKIQSDISGQAEPVLETPAEKSKRKAERETKWGKIKKISDAVENSILSWEFLMNKLSKLSSDKIMKSFTTTEMGSIVQGAAKQENIFNLETDEHLHSNAKRIFNAKSDSELNKKFLAQEVKQTGKVFAYKDGKRVDDFVMSQMEAAYMYAIRKNPDSIPTFDGMQMTDKTFKEIESFIGKELKAWVDYNVDEYLQDYHFSINDIYRQVYGTNLTKTPGYITWIREVAGKTKEKGIATNPYESNVKGMAKSSFKERVKNTNEFRLVSFNDVLTKHISEMNNFKAWAIPTKIINAVFNNQKTQKLISQHHSESMRSAIKSFQKDFIKSPLEMRGEMATLDKLRGNITTAMTALNPTIFLKQLTSIPAMAESIPSSEWAKYQFGFWANPLKAWNLLKDSKHWESRRKRGMERDIRTAQAVSGSQAVANVRNLKNRAMFLVKWGDAAAILVGGYPVYKYHFDKNLKKMGKKQAHEFALTKFEEAMDRTQQASGVKDQGWLQRSGSYAKLFSMFLTAPKQYTSQITAAVRKIHSNPKDGDAYKRLFIFGVMMPSLFQATAQGLLGLIGGDDEDEKKFVDNQIKAILQAPLNGIPIIRDLQKGVWESAMGEWYGTDVEYSPVTEAGRSLLDAVFHGARLVADDVTPEKKAKHWEQVLNNLFETVGYGYGLPAETVRKMVMENWGDIIKGETDYPIRRGLGYSRYAMGERGGKYQSNITHVKNLNKQIKESPEKAKDLRKDKTYMLFAQSKRAESSIKKLRKRIKKVKNEKVKENLKARIEIIKKAFNKKYNNIRSAS